MIPFMTEDIYQNLVCGLDERAPESIHLCDFPEVNKEMIDKELEENMDKLLKVVVLGRACRNASNIKNRQPIAQMYIKADWQLSRFYQDIIADELNVKAVEFTEDVREFTSYSFKPQLKTVGPKYGKQLNAIRQALAELDGNEAMDILNAGNPIKLSLEGGQAVLEKEDLLIESAQKDGYVSESDNQITVVLDTNLTPELVEEGFVRELISKIQTMRKEAGFEVMDKIMLYAKDNEKIRNILQKNQEQITSEVLANGVIFDTIDGYSKEWNINGENVTLAVSKQI